MGRKRLGTTGERGALVRLFLEERGGTKRYIVQWGPKSSRQQDSWPATKAGKSEAEAFFKGFEAEQQATAEAPRRLTVREMWTAYLDAEAEHLRPNTLRLYRDAWRRWEQFISAESFAEDLTVQATHAYRKALDDRKLSTATVQDAIRNVRIVYNWAERHELIRVNKWHLFIYKVAKEKRTKPRAEYRSDEFLKIWKALDPTKRGQWRAWVAVGLLGIYGNRQTEILNLQWPWITGDAVRIDPSVVKTGEESILTLFPLTRAILKVAREWAAREGYSGDYVLFAGQYAGRRHQNKKPHYSIQSLTDGIHLAEARAGVEQVKWRAGHGFRRGLVGDLADETGDVMLALQAVGDRDISMAPRYRLRRNDKVDRAVQDRAARLMPGRADDTDGATKVQPTPENDNSPADESTGESDVTSHDSITYSD
jgi:integrase